MLLVGNGIVITRNGTNEVLDNGAVIIENDVIKEIGDFAGLKAKYPDAEFIDAKGNLIMPGFINAHTHIYSSFARGMSLEGPPNGNFMEILEGLWWRMDKALTLEDVKYSAYSTILESIRYGVTTIYDHHASPFAAAGSLFTISEVANEVGMRASLCLETSDRDGEELFKEAVKENVDFIKHANKGDQDMQRGMFGMHAPFTLSNKSLTYSAEQMAGYENAGYHIHVAEGVDDAIDSVQKHGKRCVERLLEYNILGDKTIAVHCIFINEREMEILKRTGTTVVHNPESNMGNAVGCSPVVKMIAEGLPVGLGTDAYTQDMVESLKVANIIHKHHLCDPTVGWYEAPKMLYENNRDLVKNHFGIETGALKAGAKADVIISEYTPHTPLNSNTANSHIMFGTAGKNVTDTIINGKVVMRNRVMTMVDEEKVLAKARELSQALWNRA